MTRGQLFHRTALRTTLRTALALWLLAVPCRLSAQLCPQLSGTFASQQTGTTSGASVEAGTCGGMAAPEASFTFVAPRSGVYVFDTVGSTFDTVLYIRDGLTQLGCNDDIMPGIAQSRISLTLAEAQTVTVFVDGFDDQSGSYTLRINPDCPLPFRNDARDLGSPLAVSVSGTTICAGNFIGGATCGTSGAGGNGGSLAADAIFLYSAPASGDYTISTVGSNFDTVLYVRLGTCSGTELGCNDDIEPGVDSRSSLTLSLMIGQTIVIAVDGYFDEVGDYVLSISGSPATPTITGTATRTRTPTLTPTVTHTSTITATPTVTLTPQPSPTPTPTRTLTSTRTPTITTTRTATITPSRTRSLTPSRTTTATRSATPDASVTPTTPGLPTASPSPSATRVPPSPTSTATRTATQIVTGPGCCQRFLPSAVCESPVSPFACAESGGVLIGNASCVRGLCVSNEPTATATLTHTPSAPPTATASETRIPTVTPSLAFTHSPTPTVQRAVVMLPAASGEPGDPLFVTGRVALDAPGARILWRVGTELRTLLEVAAASDGTFQAQTTVPADAFPGNAQVCATAAGAGKSGEDLACAGFNVFVSRSGSITGQVLDESGAPLADSEVFLGADGGAPLAHTTTEANGHYSFVGLLSGDYVVHVAYDGKFFEAASARIQGARPANLLHRAVESGPAVYRSGAVALLAEPVYLREPMTSPWLARFGSLPGGAAELVVRFFVNVAFMGADPGPVLFSFLHESTLLFSAVDESPSPVLEVVPAAIADAYFVDVNVSELPPGDITLRIAAYDSASETELAVLQELHIDMVDLASRWLSGRVADPIIGLEADGARIAYRFTGRLPHPDFAFEFDQSLDLGLPTTPLENHVRLHARLEETYFTDGTWRGRATTQEETRLLGVNLTAQTQSTFSGPLGDQFVLSEYFLDRIDSSKTSLCPALPAASLARPFAVNPCAAGCPLTLQSRPAMATCPGLATETVAAIATDLALTVSVLTHDVRPRGERAALDLPLCRGFIDTEAARNLSVGVRYEPNAGVCPQECSFFENLCIDLDTAAQAQVRCLARTVDAEDVLLDGANLGCGRQRRARGARTDGSFNRPKAVAGDGAGHAMLVWVEDDSTPAALLYSYFDGEGWTPALSLAQSGFIDSPQVTFLAPNRALAVWQQSRLTNAEAGVASLPELLASAELYSAQWNGSEWSAAVPITNDAVADAHPSLAALPETQRAFVAWTRANSNSSQPSLVVAYSLFDGTSWAAPARVAADSIGLDYGPAASFDRNGRAAVVFTRDLDRNPASVTDRNLVFAVLNGSTWSAGETLGPGFTPSLAFSSGNEPMVAFVRPSQEAGPVTQATGEGTRSQLYFARRRQGNWSTMAIGSRVFAEHPLLRVSADNQALIVFRQLDTPAVNGRRSTLSAAASSLDQTNLTWSTGALDLQNSWLPAFDLDRAARLVFVAATQQSTSTIGTSIGDGAIEASVHPLAAHLTLASATPSDAHPLIDDVIDLSIEVVNHGLGAVVADTVVTATADGAEIGVFTIPAGLPFGATAAAALPYRISEPGVQRVVFRIGQLIIGEIVFGYPAAPASLGGFFSPVAARVELSWSEGGRGARSYRIYRDAAGAPGTFAELIGETSALRFADATPPARRTQRYGVRSVDIYGIVSNDITTIAVAVPGAVCPGDCDGDGLVSIDELVSASAIAAGQRPSADCPALGTGAVGSLEEVSAAIVGALVGCE